jgi:hypothetical protein
LRNECYKAVTGSPYFRHIIPLAFLQSGTPDNSIKGTRLSIGEKST